jgi:arabinogalactan endo-1,4-beta-galactosidase
MKQSTPALFCALLLLSAVGSRAADYAAGADLSFLKQAEDGGAVFKDAGQARPGLEIFRNHGYNWIRLRLFHTPARLPNTLDYTIALAKAARAQGFQFLLDYHYSDTWADPGKQFKPKAWEGKSLEELRRAVFEYTRDTLAAFAAAGASPDMVQIGNEVSNGMLWPEGRLPGNWDGFAALVKSGIEGVKAAAAGARPPRIMIHIDKGGDWAATKRFFDRLHTYGVEYDVMGQSYYPWWHGSILDLRECLTRMALEYRKPVILVEAAYCWTPTEYLKQPGPFPETPEGQREFLEEVHRAVLAVPDGLGQGVFWWEPAVGERRLGRRSFFDEQGNALPVISVFDRFTRGRPK